MPLHRIAPHQKDQYQSGGLQGEQSCTFQAVHFNYNLLEGGVVHAIEKSLNSHFLP